MRTRRLAAESAAAVKLAEGVPTSGEFYYIDVDKSVQKGDFSEYTKGGKYSSGIYKYRVVRNPKTGSLELRKYSGTTFSAFEIDLKKQKQLEARYQTN